MKIVWKDLDWNIIIKAPLFIGMATWTYFNIEPYGKEMSMFMLLAAGLVIMIQSPPHKAECFHCQNCNKGDESAC